MTHFLQIVLQTIKQYRLLFLGIIWLLVQSVLYLQYGFNTEFEGLKYQEDAQMISDSYELNTSRLFYSLYPILIAFFLKIKLSIKAVFVFQLLMNLVSSYCFFKLSERWLLSTSWAILATVLLLLTFQIQMWNYFLFTESLFISGIIIYSYTLSVADLSKVKNIIMLGMIFMALSFLRPNGVLLIVPTIIHLIYSRALVKPLSIYIGIAFGLLVVGFNIVLSTGQFQEFVSSAWSRSWVIWGYNGFENLAAERGGLKEIKLIFYRIFYYFSMTRPYYTNFHNMLMVPFYPIYILAIIGLFSWANKNRAVLYFIVTIVAVFSLFTILTFINWHSRFIAPILPFIIILAVVGLQSIVKKRAVTRSVLGK